MSERQNDLESFDQHEARLPGLPATSKVSLGRLEVSGVDPSSACRWVIELATRRIPTDVHLVNAYTVALASGSGDYWRALAGPRSMNFTDGKPLTWFVRTKVSDARQVRGPQLFRDVLDRGKDVGLRHYLLGGAPEVLIDLEDAIRRDYPGCQVVGACSPPFRDLSDEEWDAIYQQIRADDPDLVWVGLGTPKQDLVCERIARQTGVPSVAVGAAFDFVAGAKREAPPLIQSAGFEWLYRLISEPRRLWRRYLIGNLVFSREVAREIIWGEHSR